MTTEDILLERYGSPLLTIQQVAEVLHRSPEGLRLTLAGNNAIADKLGPAKRRIGRRVLFSVADLSRFIDDATA
jgi:hypothetical protein